MKLFTVKNQKSVTLSHDTLILILGLSGFISAADNWFISPVLPAIASDFDVSISKAGIMLTAYMIPYGIMQPVYGFFSDRFSKARILQLIVFGFTLGTAGCVIAPSFWILCIWRFLTGFFAAGIIAVSLALIGDTVPTLKRQMYVGKFMGIVFLGQGLSAGLGGTLAKFISWRMAFAFFVIISICAIILLFKLEPNVVVPVKRNFFTEIKYIVLASKQRIIFPLAFIAGFLLLGLYSYLGAFLHDVIELDYLQCGVIIMFYGLACLLAGTQIGKLVLKIGHQKTVMLGGLFALITALFLTFLPYLQAALIATISLGFGYIFIQSTLATMAFDVVTETKGLPSGLIGLGLFSGGGLGSFFSSWLISQISYKSLWMIFAIGIALFIFSINRLSFDN